MMREFKRKNEYTNINLKNKFNNETGKGER